MNNDSYDAPEFDEPQGKHSMNKVRKNVSFEQGTTILPHDQFEKFATFSFWTDASNSLANVITLKHAHGVPKA